MITQIVNSGVCWSILLLALFCYQQLWQQYLQANKCHEISGDRINEQKISGDFNAILIGVLPLLGLLGTIIGLLDCFAGIASSGASSEMLSGGIGDALLTTQLGLVCALPGWILQGGIRARYARKHVLALAGSR